jgi:hypothetical protein
MMPVSTGIGMCSLIRRIAKLEARLLPVPRPREPPSAENLRFQDALRRLLGRMEPQHRSLVIEDLNNCTGRLDYRFSPFTSIVLFYVEKHLKAHTPLELPRAVASIYLEDLDARPEHECADCGYNVPITYARPFARPPRTETVYFAGCPLCGGTAGAQAFYSKNGHCKSHEREPGAQPTPGVGEKPT